tara:strand:- start:1122 stop:1748 length:627 start_codon:yes stop_codon:yes gene_type:complete
MNVAIIGNGPSATGRHNGKFIDSCDVVIRMGSCVIDDYGEHIGTKTDVYASRWKKLENNSEMCTAADKVWMLYPKPPHNWNSNYLGDKSIQRNSYTMKRMGINASKAVYVPEQVWRPYKDIYRGALPKQSDRLCGFNIPATGTVTIDMALHLYPKDTIYVTGFDCYFTATTRYFQDRHIGKDFTHSHNTLRQYVEYVKLAAQKKIYII